MLSLMVAVVAPTAQIGNASADLMFCEPGSNDALGSGDVSITTFAR